MINLPDQILKQLEINDRLYPKTKKKKQGNFQFSASEKINSVFPTTNYYGGKSSAKTLDEIQSFVDKTGYLVISCFKIPTEIDLELKKLIKKKLYFSKSEITRFALRTFFIQFVRSQSSLDKEVSLSHTNLYSCSMKFSLITYNYIDKLIEIDNSFFQSRSNVIRMALSEYLQSQYYFHTCIVQSPNIKKMKVISFGHPVYMHEEIMQLLTNNYYPSQSEIYRLACQNLVTKLHNITEINLIHTRLKKLNFQERTKQVSMKVPLLFLDIIDFHVQEYHFQNRTEFIVYALDLFLQDELLLTNFFTTSTS